MRERASYDPMEASATTASAPTEAGARVSTQVTRGFSRLRAATPLGEGDPLGLPLTCQKGGHGLPVGVATAQGEMSSGQGEYWPVYGRFFIRLARKWAFRKPLRPRKF